MPVVDPAAPILWLLRGGEVLAPIPFVKILLGSAELAVITAEWAAEGPTSFQSADLYTPEIQKYEHSALGSTRII